MSAATESSKPVQTVQTRPLGIGVRAKTGDFYTPFPYDSESSPTPGFALPESRHLEFSPTGDYFVTVEGEQSTAVIRSAVDATPLATCGGKDDKETPLLIAFATFSPLGTYLLTWARPINGVNAENLVIYKVPTGERLAGFHQKLFHIDFWPTIQWSDNESIAARTVTNTVHFFNGNFSSEKPISKLGIPGITKVSLSHGVAPYSIAAFIGGSGGQSKNGPVKVAMYTHPDQGGKEVCCRSTFRADSVRFLWNAKGKACIAHVSTNVDSTGENYYGESYIAYMSSEGDVEKRVELPKRGPVHDVAWSPTGMEFIVIYGNMPSRATMFNDKCEPVFDFGSGSRNMLSFSPHGRYVALAGFGNLAGAVEFWDKNRMVLVGKTDLPCTTMMSWSACSRYFLAATTFPRLRVDNAVRVVRFDGMKIFHHEYGQEPLHHATFRPALRGTYADPKLTLDDMVGGPLQQVSSGSHMNGGSAGGSAGGVYRPPGSRGAQPTFKLNEQIQPGKVDKASFMSAAASVAAGVKKDELGSSSSGNGGGIGGRGGGKKFVPGMDPELMKTGPSKASLARKKRKERQAAVAAVEAQTNGNSNGNGPVPGGVESVGSLEKKVKKLRKKLRMIKELKESRDEGKTLTKEEIEKVGTETLATQEIAEVEKKIAQLSVK